MGVGLKKMMYIWESVCVLWEIKYNIIVVLIIVWVVFFFKYLCIWKGIDNLEV